MVDSADGEVACHTYIGTLSASNVGNILRAGRPSVVGTLAVSPYYRGGWCTLEGSIERAQGG